jgi:arylsulfatase A
LGWNWKFKGKPTGPYPARKKNPWYYTVNDIDWSKPVAGGPLDRGFDYYFGDGTINFPPYTWVENDKLLEIPSQDIDMKNFGFETKEGNWEFRKGPAVEGWNPYKVLPTLTRKTVEWIGYQTQGNPFFLYFALPSPHAPIIPNEDFIGKSGAGGYGDFMFQTDWVVGQVLKALKEKGLEENTIVIFSSDNGPEQYAFARAEKYEHLSMGDFRGLKRDVWEGGHHIPFIVKWPGQIKSGAVSDDLISQIDIMATLTGILGIEIPEGAAPDSYSFLPVLMGESNGPVRTQLVHNTYESKWGIRNGDWVYINDKSGEHSKMPDNFKKLRGYEDFKTKGLLFNIKKDPEQIHNLYEHYPEKVKEMDRLIEEYKAGTRCK